MIHRRLRSKMGGDHAFTLVELLVALPIMLLILLVVAVIMSDVQQTVSAGTAFSDIMNQSQALERLLRDDFMRMTREGFMVIKRRNIYVADKQYAADQVLFFAFGPWETLRSEQYQSNIARVWYGHLAPDKWGSAPSEDTDPRYWILGRQALLLSPSPFLEGSDAPRNIWDSERLYGGTWDIAGPSGLLEIRDSLTSLDGSLDVSMRRDLFMARACFRIFGEIKDAKDLDSLMRTHAVLAPNCASFRVEFAGDYEEPEGLDIDPVNQKIIWHGGDETSDMIPADVHTVGSKDVYAAVFRFDAPVAASAPGNPVNWPKLIRFTITLHDAKGHLRNIYENAGGNKGPDGRSVQFVISLQN